MEYGITEECRGAESDHQSVEILVDAVELIVFVKKGNNDDTEQRAEADK